MHVERVESRGWREPVAQYLLPCDMPLEKVVTLGDLEPESTLLIGSGGKLSVHDFSNVVVLRVPYGTQIRVPRIGQVEGILREYEYYSGTDDEIGLRIKKGRIYIRHGDESRTVLANIKVNKNISEGDLVYPGQPVGVSGPYGWIKHGIPHVLMTCETFTELGVMTHPILFEK